MNELRTIAVDCIPLVPGGENGGAKIFTIELLRALAKLKPTVKFILLTRAESHDELATLDGPNMSRLLVWGGREKVETWTFISAARKVLAKIIPASWVDRLRQRIRSDRQAGSSLASKIGADLLFCPFTAPNFYDFEIPTVCVVYDLQYKSYPEFFSSEEVTNRDRSFRDACRRSAEVAVISNYVRNSVIETQAITPDRVSTIYIRLPHRLPESQRSSAVETLNRFKLRSGEYLFYPANFWRHKNHEMLLTAFLMARARGLSDGLKLVFTGAPSGRMNELVTAAQRLGLKDRVVFAGFIADSDFACLLKNSLAVVFPSLYEGFGMPVAEAMAAGCPVACSNRTSLPEVAGDAAMLFDPRIPAQLASAIVRIANDSKLRSNLIERGIRQAALFSNTAQMAQEYWAIFERAKLHIRSGTSLQGVYEDGWSSPRIHFYYTKNQSERSVDFELHAPEWLPIKRFEITVTGGSRRQTNSYSIATGESQTLQVPIGAQSGRLTLEISPSFRPSDVLSSGDTRHLGLMVRKCILRTLDNVTTVFPEAQ